MKKINNFLIASFIVLATEYVYSQDAQDESVDLVENKSFESTYEQKSGIQVQQDAGPIAKDKDGNSLGLESVSLQQPGADTIESVVFNFEDIDLKNVADYMERVHKVKFITDDILDTNKKGPSLAGNKISFRTNAPLSKQESWNLFITFLGMAGLDLIPMSQAGFYKIVPLPNASQEAVPSYIGSSPEILPDNDMIIRYVYFMQNGDPAKVQALISKFQGATGSLAIYKDLKALIFTDKSYNIKSLMTIVKEFDKPVAPQVMSVIKLKRANVEDVVNLYKTLQPTGAAQQRAWSPDGKDNNGSDYFPSNVVLAQDKRTNTLILLGTKESVARIENFITKYVDVDANNEKPPVFVYYLEYTNATEMQKTLSSLISYGSQTSAGQYGGVRDGQKYLQQMNIVADSHSNSLIINTNPEDYSTVEDLIKQLDVPQKQIALEVLIVQVTSINTKELGSQISGPNNDNTFLRNVSAQTSGIPPATGIVTTAGGNGLAQSIKSSLASLLAGPIGEAGSTLLTFGQPIWAVFKILKTISTTKILSNPFLVVSNNSKGFMKIGTSRRVVTGEVVSGGNTSASGYQTAEANLSLTIVPQVNDQKMINLSIAIENNQFVNPGPNNAVQDQKSITTMATVADGEVLVLGGIMADNVSGSANGVPFLSNIPIFGWFFKSKSNTNMRNVFITFICPKIIDNITSQEDVQRYTRSKIEEAQDYLRIMEETADADTGQDPLDRAFFGKSERRSDDLTTERLIDRKELVSHHERVKRTKKEFEKKRSQDSHVQTKKNRSKKEAVVEEQQIDMSEKQDNRSDARKNSIKNIVQSTSGDLV